MTLKGFLASLPIPQQYNFDENRFEKVSITNDFSRLKSVWI